MIELLGVVDADDLLLGALPRAEVHRRRLRHRAVHVLVTNPDGAIYMQRRADHKDCAPGLWDTSAAGHVDFGEEYDHAAVRELREELRIESSELAALWRLPASAASGHEFVRVYHCCSSCEPDPDPGEIAAGGWYTPAALEAWIAREPHAFTAVFRDIFQRAQATGLAR